MVDFIEIDCNFIKIGIFCECECECENECECE
jgi:hypothetical protein